MTKQEKRNKGSRLLSVSDHAVERLRERTGEHHLNSDDVRRLVVHAVFNAGNDGGVEPHYVEGQKRVKANVLGTEIWLVIGKDTTGWSLTGQCVTTVLTQAQVDARENG